MAAVSPIDGLPPEMLIKILSRLSWKEQLGVRRVSRRWRAAVDACLRGRRELHFEWGWRSGIWHFETMISHIQRMPALRRLCIMGDPYPGPNGDSSALNSVTVERLCMSCPLLEQVSLGCRVEKDELETLLLRMPDLKLLALRRELPDWELLPLLPEGLQKLTLAVPEYLDPAIFRHLRRLPHLRELSLSVVSSEDLQTVLFNCPQLEVLWVRHKPSSASNWTDALSHCPLLKDLIISCLWMDVELDPCDVLSACGRLESLTLDSIRLQSLTLHPARSRHGLTHLRFIRTGMDDVTFRRLADLLPRLRHLELRNVENFRLTGAGLADGLARFKNLEVLKLHFWITGRVADTVLNALSELPLTSLSISGIEYDPHQMGVMLRRCPRLTKFFLWWVTIEPYMAFADGLTGGPLQQGEVTLVVPSDMARSLVGLPRNIRVIEDESGVWRKMTGRARPRECCCDDWQLW